jgi:hypothetical protein
MDDDDSTTKDHDTTIEHCITNSDKRQRTMMIKIILYNMYMYTVPQREQFPKAIMKGSEWKYYIIS